MAGPRLSSGHRNKRKDRAVEIVGCALVVAAIVVIALGVILYVSGQ